MKKLRNYLMLSLTLVGLLLAGTAAKADTVDLTLLPAFQMGPGGTFTFDAIVTNNGPSVVFLNGDSTSVNLPLGALNDTPFFANFPLSLDSGASITDVLFTVVAPPWGAGSNLYTGSFTLLGGADGNAGDVLATVNFNVQVTPEPSNLLLFGTGVLTLGVLTGRKFLA